MRRSTLGPDPLATVTYAGIALVVTAALLGASRIDGGVGFVDILVALAPVAALAGYLIWVNRTVPDDDTERLAVSILTAQADDPTLRGDDPISRAAADLVAAVDDAEREAARLALLRALGR